MRSVFPGKVAVLRGMDGQYLQVEIDNRTKGEPYEPASEFDFGAVSARLSSSLEAARRFAAEFPGKRVAIWGAGAKGVTFLNRLGLGTGSVKLVIDINPNKSGCFIAGTGQEIVPPSALKKEKMDLIVGMNRAYEGEIRAEATRQGFSGKLVFA